MFQASLFTPTAIKAMQGGFELPTVKQHLAVLRVLFDWLVTDTLWKVNPAHAVHGPKYVVKKGKTLAGAPDSARRLVVDL